MVSKFNNQINNHILNIPTYHHELCLRSNNKKGGWTSLYINKDIQYKKYWGSAARLAVPTDMVKVLLSGKQHPARFRGYGRYRMRPFVKAPQQCFNCQSFGHMARTCWRENQTCRYCAGRYPSSRCKGDSQVTLKCANCGKGHALVNKSKVAQKKVERPQAPAPPTRNAWTKTFVPTMEDFPQTLTTVGTPSTTEIRKSAMWSRPKKSVEPTGGINRSDNHCSGRGSGTVEESFNWEKAPYPGTTKDDRCDQDPLRIEGCFKKRSFSGPRLFTWTTAVCTQYVPITVLLRTTAVYSRLVPITVLFRTTVALVA